MKKTSRLCLALLPLVASSSFFLLTAAPHAYSADVFGPPRTVDYQGSVLDGNGNPLAPTTAANYEMQFRLYDAQTAGTLVWAEKQLVTVKEGKFSVRLGEGSPILAAVGGLNEGTVDHTAVGLPGAFGGNERFLGVTVVIPGQTRGEIQPRLAFLASPFSYVAGRAQSADRLVQSASDAPSSLNVSGISYVSALISTSSTLGKTSSSVLANATAGAVAATLPANPDKREITVTKNDPSANPVTVVPPSGGLINGSATPISLAKRGDSVTLRNTDANNWIVVSRYAGEGSPVFADTPIGGGLLARGGDPGLQGINKNGYAFSGNGGDNDSGMFSNSDGIVRFLSNNSERLRVDTGGIVVSGGITGGNFSGTNFSGSNFSGTNVNATNAVTAPNVYAAAHRFTDNPNSGLFSFAGGPSLFANGSPIVQTAPGRVGIGGPVGSAATLYVSGYFASINPGSYGYLASSGTGFSPGGNNLYSIWSDQRVAASEFNAVSDARIKNVIGVSDSKSDLVNLMQLKITDYSFVDTVANGNRKEKKVIAQEVEKVYPSAITKTTNVVPDIMNKAPLEEGWIKMVTDLKVGERIRIGAVGRGHEVYVVTEVAKDMFRTTFDGKGKDKDGKEMPAKEVFVYGREVQDFRVVDYDALGMLNISATQQIKKDSDTAEEALRKENEILNDKLAKQEERLASLEKENTTRETRLAALEAALSGKPLNKTVSAPAKPTNSQ